MKKKIIHRDPRSGRIVSPDAEHAIKERVPTKKPMKPKPQPSQEQIHAFRQIHDRAKGHDESAVTVHIRGWDQMNSKTQKALIATIEAAINAAREGTLEDESIN